MPIIRTRFRPWEDLDVSDEEANSMRSMGLLSQTGSVEPQASELPDAAPALDEAPAAEPAPEPPAPARRPKTTTSVPPEEVNTDGSSEEGSGQAQEG